MPLIDLRGTITKASAESVRLRLLEVAEAREPGPLWLLVDSAGGSAASANEIVEDIKKMRTVGFSFGAQIHTAHSAAACIALACDWREIRASGSFALHPFGCIEIEGHEFCGDSFTLGLHIRSKLEEMRRSAQRTYDLLNSAGVTLTTAMNAKLAATNQLRLNAQECMETGVVGRIIM